MPSGPVPPRLLRQQLPAIFLVFDLRSNRLQSRRFLASSLQVLIAVQAPARSYASEADVKSKFDAAKDTNRAAAKLAVANKVPRGPKAAKGPSVKYVAALAHLSFRSAITSAL